MIERWVIIGTAKILIRGKRIRGGIVIIAGAIIIKRICGIIMYILAVWFEKGVENIVRKLSGIIISLGPQRNIIVNFGKNLTSVLLVGFAGTEKIIRKWSICMVCLII